MKKTCGLFVAGSLLGVVIYFLLLRHFIPEIPLIPSAGIAVLGGVSLLALFGAISTVVQGISDKLVLSRAVKGERYRDGKRAAAVGRIEASGLSTLTAPFSGRECLAYEYEVYELIEQPRTRGSSTTTKKLYCSGYGSVSSHVRTNQGEIRILGFPLLDELPKTYTESDEQRARANEYIAATKFQNVTKNIGNVFTEFEDLFLDADGIVRKDLGDPVQIESKHKLTEVIVPAGMELCAIGTYSATNQALKAKTAALPIRLIPGNAREAERHLRKTGMFQIVFALIFFLAINGIVAFLYDSNQKQRYNIPESEQHAKILQLAEAGDYEKLTKLFQHGVNPDATDSQSRTLLQTTSNDELVRFLLKSGANPNAEDPETLETPLFDASRTGNLSRMKILIEGGAKVNAVCAIPWSHTPIDEAIRYGQSEAIEILMKTGAADPRVTSSNGSAIIESGPELAICRQYLRAIQNEDKATLKALSSARYEYFFDDIDFAIWKTSYPVSIESFEGFSNDTAATISLRGRKSDHNDSEWMFQMQKFPDGWKIHQSWPLTGEDQRATWR